MVSQQLQIIQTCQGYSYFDIVFAIGLFVVILLNIFLFSMNVFRSSSYFIVDLLFICFVCVQLSVLDAVKTIDKQRSGRSVQYMVKLKGYEESKNSKEPASNIIDTRLIAYWMENNNSNGCSWVLCLSLAYVTPHQSCWFWLALNSWRERLFSNVFDYNDWWTVFFEIGVY